MDKAAESKFGRRVRQASNVWWGWLIGLLPPTRGSIGLPGDGAIEYRERIARDVSRNRRYRISHNYHMTWADLSALVKHCETHQLEISLHGNSWHSARCFAVVMTAKQPEE